MDGLQNPLQVNHGITKWQEMADMVISCFISKSDRIGELLYAQCEEGRTDIVFSDADDHVHGRRCY